MALKILVVDDSKMIRLLAQSAFSAYECDVIQASDGAQGLETALRERPDLVILDITMDVMTGEEMLEKMKAEDTLKEIPVIMMTAAKDDDTVIRAVKMGVRDYIKKPFTEEQLLESVKHAVSLEPKTD